MALPLPLFQVAQKPKLLQPHPPSNAGYQRSARPGGLAEVLEAGSPVSARRRLLGRLAPRRRAIERIAFRSCGPAGVCWSRKGAARVRTEPAPASE